MACVTLKRHLEFDPLHSPGNASKRRRYACVPRSPAPRIPPTKSHQMSPSPFDEVLPKYTTDVISSKIQDEVRRMARRRQLYYQQRSIAGPSSSHHSGASGSGASPSPSPPISPPLSPSSPSSSLTAASHRAGGGGGDQPLFTMRQVSMICEKMVKDREGEVKEEYDKVLNMKLAEQYDAFMKFTYDEIQRRFQDTPMTYVS